MKAYVLYSLDITDELKWFATERFYAVDSASINFPKIIKRLNWATGFGYPHSSLSLNCSIARAATR